MLNSKLKRKGLSLEEGIHEGVFGNISELTIDDWKYLEVLLGNFQDTEDTDEDSDDDTIPLPQATQGSVNLVQDDWTEDGSELPQVLEVVLAQDSDIHIRTVDNRGGLLRFRNMIGGGRYPNTYFALRNLYDAMQEDKKNPNGSWVDAANRYMKDK